MTNVTICPSCQLNEVLNEQHMECDCCMFVSVEYAREVHTHENCDTCDAPISTATYQRNVGECTTCANENPASSTQVSIIKKLIVIAGAEEFERDVLESLSEIRANKLIVQLMKEARLS